MYLTVLSVISFIINASLIFYIIKQNNTIKELEIKLKITRDYANLEAEKTLKATKRSQSPVIQNKLAKEPVNDKSANTTEVADAIKRPTRRRKKKNNNNV